MAEYDQRAYLKVLPAIYPAVVQGVSDGISIDTKGYESVTFIVFTGVTTAGVINFKIQHADDNGSGAPGTFADITAADDLLGTIPSTITYTTDDNKAWRFGYRGKKQWVRLQSIETSAWTDALFGAVCVLGEPKIIPVP